jgi:hypothetical protein
MNPLSLLPLRDWGYIALALAVAALGAIFVAHEREIGAHKAEAQLQHERAAVAQASARAASAAMAERARQDAAQLEITHATQDTIQRLAAAAASNTADRGTDAFSLRLDAYLRARAAPGSAPAAASSPTAADAAMVYARLLDRADARASDLAGLADQRGAAGLACQQSYEALTPVKPPR